jgi:hypothetical protein
VGIGRWDSHSVVSPPSGSDHSLKCMLLVITPSLQYFVCSHFIMLMAGCRKRLRGDLVSVKVT